MKGLGVAVSYGMTLGSMAFIGMLVPLVSLIAPHLGADKSGPRSRLSRCLRP